MDDPRSMSSARRLVSVVALALAATAGCTDSYYDYGAAWSPDLVTVELPAAPPDYGLYTTFAFNRAEPSGDGGGAFTRPFVETAREELSESLGQLGFIEVSVDEDPDLVVNFYDQIEERYAYIGNSYYYCWYGWFWPYPCVEYVERRYNVGTVVIDLLDTSTEQSVWRMVGEGVFTDDARELQDRVRAAIDHAIDSSPESLLAGPEGT